jgi:hypothetical protein
MIFNALPGTSAAPPVATVAAEHAMTSRIYESAAAGSPPEEFSVEGFEGEQAELKAPAQDLLEEFDWNNPKVNREFIKLEQKVLARKASIEEKRRYQTMRRDRNSQIFAERYVRDYAEVQRLKKLSEKLAEIQQYLRPLHFG